jgi:serine/threonine-protein phosphatase 5
VGSDGELEEEVDMDRIITDQDREQAAELKVKANRAFAGKSPL